LFFLWLGWYAFNVGSIGNITLNGNSVVVDRSQVIGRIAENTTLAAAAAAIFSLFWVKFSKQHWDIKSIINGTLAGLVVSTSIAAFVENWAAFVIGLISSPVYFLVSYLMVRAKLDDALDSVAIHCACGCWSCISVSLFADKALMEVVYGPVNHWGLFMGGGGLLLGINALAVTSVCLWGSLWAALFFIICKKTGYLRASLSAEVAGMDVQHMQLTNIQRSIMKDLN